MKKWLRRVILLVVLLLIVIILSILGYRKINSNNNTSKDDNIVIKKNVKIITTDNKKDEQPIEVNDNSIIFESKPNHYKKGDVIVSGITDAAPNGFIRKVIEIKKNNSSYEVKTEPAVLTDVFEKADIYQRIMLTENGIESESYVRENSSINLKDTKIQTKLCKAKEGDNGTNYAFAQTFEEKNPPLKISGEMGISVWVEVDIHIKHGDIKGGMAVRTEEGSKIAFGCSETYKDEIEKNFYEKTLPKYQFLVGGIPIVLTNDLKFSIGVKPELEGNIGLIYEFKNETKQGFQYDSRTGTVEELNESKPSTDGIEWNTVSASGKLSGGPEVHIITKLYGSCGMDFSIGISGEVSGVVKVSDRKDLDGFAGRLDMSLKPKIAGTLVVDVPVLDNNLEKQPLFQVKLDPIWEKHFESSANWEKDLETLNGTDSSEEWIGESETTKESEEGDEGQLEASYSNEYFDVYVPESWKDQWTVSEEQVDVMCKRYIFSHDPKGIDEEGGVGEIYVLDLGDYSTPLSYLRTLIPDTSEEIGMTSFGANDVFDMEVANGFFYEGGATIILK